MLRRLKKKKRVGKGFTLVEMIVTFFIFSLVFGAASGLFVSAIRNQSRALASQQILRETSYLIEYISRAIRMVQKQLPPTPECFTKCLSSNGLNYELPTDTDLRFRNYNCVCQRFFLEGGQLKEQKEWTLSDGVPTGGTTFPLTSPNLQIESLKFNLLGASQTDYLQPRVTIFLEIRKLGPEPQPRIKIQTTISQRNPDIQL